MATPETVALTDLIDRALLTGAFVEAEKRLQTQHGWTQRCACGRWLMPGASCDTGCAGRNVVWRFPDEPVIAAQDQP